MGRAVLRGDDVLRVGTELSGMVGVHAVTVDPVRRQLVVRFDARALDLSRVREAARPLPPRTLAERWLLRLSRATELVPVVLSSWAG